MKTTVLLLTLALTGIGAAKAGGLSIDNAEAIMNADSWIANDIDVDTAQFAHAPINAFQEYEAVTDYFVDVEKFKQSYDSQG